MTANVIVPATVPLTLWQKVRLLADCVPVVFFATMLAAYVTILADISGGRNAAVVLFVAVVILVTGHRAIQRMRDVLSGIALVHEDLLEHTTGRGSQRHRRWHYSGDFTHLGRLQFTRKSYRRVQTGVRHRVTYSPASRIAWSAEPLG